MIYSITPCPAPRMTQSDKWKKRACVLRYFAFRDEIKLHKVTYVSGQHVIFYMPMPKTWSKVQRANMAGMPHMQKPDIDNLIKALLDGIYGEDCQIWRISAEKVWSTIGQIEIY